MREVVTVQVGQCGNQVGLRFWEHALREQGAEEGRESLSTFFRVEQRQGKETLKSRAVLIDMEEGVINRTFKSKLGALFDKDQTVTDVSGAGNNFSHGYSEYGSKYKEKIFPIHKL